MEKFINKRDDIWYVSLVIYSSSKGLLFGKKNNKYEILGTTLKEGTKDLMDIITKMFIKELRIYENKYFEYQTVNEFVKLHERYYGMIPDMNCIPEWISESIDDYENDNDNICLGEFTYSGILYRYIRGMIEKNHMLNLDFTNNNKKIRYYIMDIDNFSKYENNNILNSINFYNVKNNMYAKKYKYLEWVKYNEVKDLRINDNNKNILRFISLSSW